MPLFDKSDREVGTFSRTGFRFDSGTNLYTCAAGKALYTLDYGRDT